MIKFLLSVVILFGFDHIHYILFSFQWCIVAMTRLSLSELKDILLGCMNFTSIFTLCLARKQLKFTSSGIITVVKRKKKQANHKDQVLVSWFLAMIFYPRDL